MIYSDLTQKKPVKKKKVYFYNNCEDSFDSKQI